MQKKPRTMFWSILSLSILGVLFLAFFGCGMSTHWAENKFVQPEVASQQAMFEKNLPRILEDLRDMSSYRLFTLSERHKNAAPFLIKNLGWSEATAPVIDGADKIKELREQLEPKLNFRQRIEKLIAEPNLVQNVPAEWIDQLMTYDSINFWAEDVRGEELKKVFATKGVRQIEALSLIAPFEVAILRTWVTVRIAQLKIEGDHKKAMQLLHHMANLFWSDPDIISQMVGIQFLRYEQMVADLFPGSEVVNVPHERIDRWKRVVFTWADIFDVQRHTALPTELEAFQLRELGYCGGVRETLMTTYFQNLFWERHMWPETDHTEQILANRERTQKRMDDCGLQAMNFLNQPAAMGGDDWFGQLPFARRWMGTVMMSIATRDFNHYEQPAAGSDADMPENSEDVSIPSAPDEE